MELGHLLEGQLGRDKRRTLQMALLEEGLWNSVCWNNQKVSATAAVKRVTRVGSAVHRTRVTVTSVRLIWSDAKEDFWNLHTLVACHWAEQDGVRWEWRRGPWVLLMNLNVTWTRRCGGESENGLATGETLCLDFPAGLENSMTLTYRENDYFSFLNWSREMDRPSMGKTKAKA